jgi:hypothetical protein
MSVLNTLAPADRIRYANYALNIMGATYATDTWDDSPESEETINVVRAIMCCECGQECDRVTILSIPDHIMVGGERVNIYYRGREEHGPSSHFVLFRNRDEPAYVCVDADKATPERLTRAAAAVLLL